MEKILGFEACTEDGVVRQRMLSIQYLGASHQQNIEVEKDRVLCLKWQTLPARLILSVDYDNYFNVFRRQEGVYYLRLAGEVLKRTGRYHEQLDREQGARDERGGCFSFTVACVVL